jgi:GH24 family phage-related lysozyme (muramidase)
MKLVSNLRSKMRAYSFWALLLATVTYLSAEAIVAFSDPLPSWYDPYVVGPLVVLFMLFGVIGWFVDQVAPDLWRTAQVFALTILISVGLWFLLASASWSMDTAQTDLVPPLTPQSDRLPTWEETAEHAIPMIKQWEGSGPTFACAESASGVCVRAYLDTIAEPDLWTICHGETSHTGTPVRQGDVRTIEQCDEGLSRIARDQYWSIYRTGVTIGWMPPQVDATVGVDLPWNVGAYTVLKASALAAINRGDFADACRRYTFYDRAGGRVVTGLVNRRAFGYRVCMSGVT